MKKLLLNLIFCFGLMWQGLYAMDDGELQNKKLELRKHKSEDVGYSILEINGYTIVEKHYSEYGHLIKVYIDGKLFNLH